MSVYLYVIKKDARAIPRQNVYVWVFLHVCDVITQKQLNWLGSNFFCYLTHLGQGWFWATKIWIQSLIFTVQKFGLIFSKRLLLEINFWNRSCFAFYNKSFFSNHPFQQFGTNPFFIPSYNKVLCQSLILQEIWKQILLNSISLYKENSYFGKCFWNNCSYTLSVTQSCTPINTTIYKSSEIRHPTYWSCTVKFFVSC